MKKTLIALLALAGVACGATTGADLTKAWQDALTDANYTVDGDFTYSIDFTLTGNIPYYDGNGYAQLTGNILTLADDYYLVSQTHTFWGLNSSVSNNITAQGYTFSKNGDSTLYTYTGNGDGVRPITWARNSNNSSSAERTLGGALSVNVAYDGENTSITLSYGGSAITDKFVITNAELDATKFVLYNGATVSSSNISVTPSVPEPATATLSLLALAGLAARRRRR